MLGNVAELANANVFMVKDGVVYHAGRRTAHFSPASRASASSRCCATAGITVIETVLRYSDLQTADEIFSTGNCTKVLPVTRIDERSLQPGPVYRQARELYWDFAHSDRRVMRGGEAAEAIQ